MNNTREQFTKRLYQTVLSTKQEPKYILKALNHILRLAFQDSRHFVFLLDRVPWFQSPYLHFINVLQKTIRLYRGHGKQATQVGYNILSDGLRRSQAYQPAVQCIHSLAQGRWDWQIIQKSLRKNYPHKVCPQKDHQTYVQGLILLAKKFPQHHVDIIGLIMQNLVLMDTELLEGDQYISQPFPPDLKIRDLRYKNSQLKEKYDVLLVRILNYLSQIRQEEFLLKEMFMVFQQKLLLADKTKMIQFTLFYLAQTSKKTAAMFVSLLLGNILDFNFKNTNQAYINSTFYLSSFVIRSTHFKSSSINKMILRIIQELIKYLITLDTPFNYQSVYLKNLKENNIRVLYLIQSVLHVLAVFPQVRLQIIQSYNQFIKLAHEKLYFEAFMNQEIIKKLGIQFQCQGQPIKIENKFNPIILPKSSEKIDPIFKFYQEEKNLPDNNSQLSSSAQGQNHKRENPFKYDKISFNFSGKYGGIPSKKLKLLNHESTTISVGSCQQSTTHNINLNKYHSNLNLNKGYY